MNICYRFCGKIHNKVCIGYLKRKNGLLLNGKIIVQGWPMIDIRNGAKIVIDDGVLLNSSNYGYHINMHSPVKLFADQEGAIIKIGEKTRIHGSCIHAQQQIFIGKNCLIAANCQIFDCSGHDLSFDSTCNRINTKGKAKPIIVEDDVWIGANSIILPGVRIGEGSIIAAGSVVVKNVAPHTIVAGNPAVVVKIDKNL